MTRSFYKRLYMPLVAITVAMASMTTTAHGEQPSEITSAEKLAESSRTVTYVTVNRAELVRFFGDLDSLEAKKRGVYTTEFDSADQIGVAVLAKDSAAPLSKLKSSMPDGGAATAKDSLIRVVQSRFSADQIDATLESLKDFLSAHQIIGTFRYEARYDAIVVSTRESDLKKINRLPKLPAKVITVGGTGGPAIYNEGMASPYIGGAAIYDAQRRRCTSGIPARNDVRTPGYFTAGHCFAGNAHTFSKRSLSGDFNTGKVTQYLRLPESRRRVREW